MDLMAILVLGGIGWLWHEAMRAREMAMDEARLACAGLGVQWLDESVELRSFTLGRNEEGELGVRRIYGFRYLEADHLIREGVVMLHGKRVQSVLLDTVRIFS